MIAVAVARGADGAGRSTRPRCRARAAADPPGSAHQRPQPSSARRRRPTRPAARTFPGTRSWRRTGAATSTTTPTRPTPTAGPGRWATDLATSSALFAARVRLGHLRQPRPHRDDLRRARTARAGAARPGHARGRWRRCDLPPRSASTNPFQDFSGGGYFYLDNHDRAVIPTDEPPRLVIGETGGAANPVSRSCATTTSAARCPSGDAIISALPDWYGRIWFASRQGRRGDDRPGERRGAQHRHPASRSATRSRSTRPAASTSSPTRRCTASTRATGGRPSPGGATYANIGVAKPGQTEAGSGTTPTLIGRRYVAITDNADPMDVVVYKRRRGVERARGVVCTLAGVREGRQRHRPVADRHRRTR